MVGWVLKRAELSDLNLCYLEYSVYHHGLKCLSVGYSTGVSEALLDEVTEEFAASEPEQVLSVLSAGRPRVLFAVMLQQFPNEYGTDGHLLTIYFHFNLLIKMLKWI